MFNVISHLKLFLFLVFLSTVILVADLAHFLSFPKQLLGFVTSPISYGFYQTNKKIVRQFSSIFAVRSAYFENQALKGQLGQLLSENARLRKDLAETQSQLTQAKYINPVNYTLIPARPIGVSRYLKIDKGADSGIIQDQAVIFNDNYAGKIIQVSQRSASVQLLADPDSKVAAFTLGLSGKAKGVLVGQFGSEILLDKILHEEKVSVGDLVYSEGTEGFLPRGLILGKVTQVFERENQVFKQAKVSPNFDIGDMELVYVIKE